MGKEKNEMENTLENKAKLFAQYWGQKVRCWDTGSPEGLGVVGATFIVNPYLSKTHLLLKSVSLLTDQDAIKVFDTVWSKVGNKTNKTIGFKIDFGRDWAYAAVSKKHGLIPSGLFDSIDYLRSQGYALPYMGLSVETMVEYGWIKLI